MREVGIQVFDCSYKKRNLARFIVSFLRFLRYKGESDIVYVGFVGQPLMLVVKLFTRKKIIFDALISTYQVFALERKTFAPRSWRASFIRYFERLSCLLADRVTMDTNQHIEYMVKEYDLDRTKFRRILTVSDTVVDEEFLHIKQDQEFLVHFHGEFNHSHGVRYILEAIKLLPHVKFQIVGGGRFKETILQDYEIKDLANATFVPPVPFEQIPAYIARGTVCLGIFGETLKHKLVIPLKAVEVLAVRRALITADSASCRELFTHKQSAYLVPAADPQAIADAIEELRGDPELRERIARRGHEIFLEQCVPRAMGEAVLSLATQLLEHG